MSIPCRQAFSEQLLLRAKENPSIYALCTDSRGSVTLNRFAEELPGQFVEVGIAEQNCIGIAAGLANAGLKPFAAGPASFYSMRSAEQVKVDVAYSGYNVKVVGISGGVSYGALGTSHHSLQDIATMTSIPGLTVILPSDSWQTRSMTDYLIDRDDTPAYVRMGRGAVPDLYGPDGVTGMSVPFQTGKAIELMRGEDALIVATGEMVFAAYQTGKILAAENIRATVLDMHTLSPLDEQAILEAAQPCKLVVTMEEHSINGGLGGLVASLIGEHSPRLLKKYALPNENIVTGTSAEIFRHYGLESGRMAREIQGILQNT